jgi:hypothetical protein
VLNFFNNNEVNDENTSVGFDQENEAFVNTRINYLRDILLRSVFCTEDSFVEIILYESSFMTLLVLSARTTFLKNVID